MAKHAQPPALVVVTGTPDVVSACALVVCVADVEQARPETTVADAPAAHDAGR